MKRPQASSVFLYVASFLSQSAITMIGIGLVYFLRQKFTLSAQVIGMAASTCTGTYLVSCVVGSKATERLNPRSMLLVSLVGMALSILWLLLTDSVVVIFIALGLYGIFMSALWPQIEAWLSRGKEGEHLNRAMSGFNISWSVGAALAPTLAGILSATGVSLPLTCAVILFLLVATVLVGFSLSFSEMRTVKPETDLHQEAHSSDTSTRLRYFCWIGIVLVYVGFSVFQTVFPLYATEELGYSTTMTGAFLTMRGITSCIFFLFIGKWSWWQKKVKVVLLAQLIFAMLCIIGSFLSSTLSLFLFFIAFGALFPFAYTLSIFHGVSGSVHRARRMIIHESLLTVGTIVGASLGGMIYEYTGYSTILVMLGTITAIIVAIETIVAQRIHKKSGF